MLEQLKALMQEEFLHQNHAPGPSTPEQQSSVARQPVFDVNGQVWGYELLYRGPANLHAADIANGAVATASVIINGFETVRPSLKQSQKILINFTGNLRTSFSVKETLPLLSTKGK